jgi:hypothetical protein
MSDSCDGNRACSSPPDWTSALRNEIGDLHARRTFVVGVHERRPRAPPAGVSSRRICNRLNGTSEFGVRLMQQLG